jgi:hypothetical protein
MHHLGLSLIAQIALTIGLAGLFWPEKLMPVFEVLMFPWPSSFRTVRANSVGAVLLSILLVVGLVSRAL